MSAPLSAPEGLPSEDGCPRCRELEQQNAALLEENGRLKAQIGRSERRTEKAVRAGKRQAAPFSKGSPKRRPRKPGRRPGPDYGTPARRPIPEHVDETIEVLLPDACPHCGGEAIEAHEVAEQYQTELPPIRPVVTRFLVHLGSCIGCGKAVRGRHPRQTSDALGAAASQLGSRAVALGAYLNKGLGLSFAKCVALFDTLGLHVSRSGLCQALQRLANAAEPTYQALVQSVRDALVVSPDETGWKVGGELKWLWVFATPRLTVYSIQDGRGFDQAASVLGADFGGVLIRDGWAPYRRFDKADHQTCLAHLLRRCRDLIDASLAGAARFPHTVRRILKAALDLRDARQNQEISAEAMQESTAQLVARMERLLQGNIQHPPNRRFVKHLTREQPYLFTFLRNPDVEATNWWAEQAIRPAVVTRKVFGGNRTWNGAATQQILASVLATSHKQGQPALELLQQIYCAPQPLILHLEPPPATLLQPP